MKRLISVNQLCSSIGLAKQTIYNRLSSGGDLPPAIRLNRALRWREDEVNAWIDSKRANQPCAQPPAAVTPPRKRGRPTKAAQLSRQKLQGDRA